MTLIIVEMAEVFYEKGSQIMYVNLLEQQVYQLEIFTEEMVSNRYYNYLGIYEPQYGEECDDGGQTLNDG